MDCIVVMNYDLMIDGWSQSGLAGKIQPDGSLVWYKHTGCDMRCTVGCLAGTHEP